MHLKKLLEIYSHLDCNKIYVKRLSPNDNSKNQVYLGGSFDVLNILPVQEIIADDSGDWKKTRFKSKINFSWINDEGKPYIAPEAQLILYPKYPEVRFSGFLKRCENAPSDLMNPRIDGRLLFLGVSNKNDVLGYVVSPESSIATEVSQLTDIEETGVFKVITLVGSKIERNSKLLLLKELKRINDLEWINAKRLDSHGVVLPCKSSNCGGYTLEAELGITPNGYSEPDYLGWEIKQFNVSRFERMGSSIITLMTPEPTDGFYVKNGIESFIRQYGYIDKLGRESRLNFGGIHKYDQIQPTTQLKLVLEGYNAESGKITNSEGYLGLLDSNDNIAASWSFSSLLKKWNNKHANACYVPSLNRKISDDIFSQQYYYSNTIMLGTKTDFSLFLKQIANGSIYYDPGIKLELAIEGVRRQNIKRRSQFRIKSSNLTHLYEQNEIIDLHSLK